MASALGNILAKMENRLSSSGSASIGGGAKTAFLQGGDLVNCQPEPEIECSDHTHCEVYHVLYHESMETFAKDLEKAGTSKKRFLLYNTLWDKFADGTDNITIGAKGRDKEGNGISLIDKPTFFKGKDLLFIASFHSNDVTMSQFHVLAHLCESLARSLTVLLPFYSTATMERVDIGSDGVIPTASTLARFFNGLPSMGYPLRLMTYDIHTLQNRFFLTGHAVASLHTATTLMKTVIASGKTGIDSIAFPDAGAQKRFSKLFHPAVKSDRIITCEKVRVGNERIVTVIDGQSILRGDQKALHVLIVDDIINSGNTLLACEQALKNIAGDKLKVSIYTTHAVFNQSFFDKVEANQFIGIEALYVTNSIPNKIKYSETVPTQRRTDITTPRELNTRAHSFGPKINLVVLGLQDLVVKDL